MSGIKTALNLLGIAASGRPADKPYRSLIENVDHSLRTKARIKGHASRARPLVIREA